MPRESPQQVKTKSLKKVQTYLAIPVEKKYKATCGKKGLIRLYNEIYGGLNALRETSGKVREKCCFICHPARMICKRFKKVQKCVSALSVS
eukprot:g6178.t1